MKIISGVLLAGLILFLFFTRNYKKTKFDKKEYFYSSACFLLEKCHLSKLFSDSQKQRIFHIYIGEDFKTAVLKYQCKRISYGIYGSFLVLVLLLIFSLSGGTKNSDESTRIMRPEYGEGTKEISKDIMLSDEKKEDKTEWTLDFKVQEKQYTKKEWKNVLKDVETWIDNTILGENVSVEEVRTPLRMIKTYPGTSIKIKWQTDGKYIKEDGTLKNTYKDETIPEEGVLAELTAKISCSDYKAEYTIYLKILPKKYTAAESAWHQLEAIISEQEETTRKKDFFEIPKKIGNYYIIFSKEKDSTGIIIAGIGIILVIGCTIVPVEKLKEEEKKREKQLNMDYPKVINKFVLLAGAGLTIRGVFEKLVREYDRNKKNGGEKRYVYEEMTVIVRAMENGTSEADALEAFGKRIQLLPYLRFTSLLIQNQKKGSKDLLCLLENEAVAAMEKNKEMIRIMGEEAGTKLLLPMLMMLCIVFAIIMIPAFMSF